MTCEHIECDKEIAPDSDGLCQEHLEANLRQGVIEGELAAAWAIHCQQCLPDIRLAGQEHGGPSPHETGVCPVCGCEEVVFSRLETGAHRAIDELMQEVGDA